MAANIELLSPIGECETIVENTSGGVSKGAFRTIGSVNCFAFSGAASGDEFESSSDNPSDEDPTALYVVKAKNVETDKTTALAIAIGSKVYYDEANDHVTTEQTGNNLIGYALESASAATTRIRHTFDGTLESFGGLA